MIPKEWYYHEKEYVEGLVRERDEARKLLAEAGEIIEKALHPLHWTDYDEARSILARIKEATT